MFVARAGLKTRNFREGQSGLTALLAPKRKKKDDDYSFICWVPFMLGPCIGGLIGLVVLLGGTAMSATGYYARHFASTYSDNGTHVIRNVDSSREFHMHNMTFVGPVIMGCGCFVIVIACVVVCEQRDKDVRVKIAEAKKKKDQRNSKRSKFYDSVVERLKKSDILNTGNKDKITVTNENECNNKIDSSRKPSKMFTLVPCIVHSEDETDDPKTAKQYTHIGEALRSIPMDIFTINVGKEGNSMLPIKLVDGTSQIEEFKNSKNHPTRFPIRKCLSATCIHELAKVEETKLDQLFPDRHTWLRKSKTDIDLLKHLDKSDFRPQTIHTSKDRLPDIDIESLPSKDPVENISGGQSVENQGKSISDENCSTTGSLLTINSYNSDTKDNNSDINTTHGKPIHQHNCDSDNVDTCDTDNQTDNKLFHIRNKEIIKTEGNVILCEASVHKEEGTVLCHVDTEPTIGNTPHFNYTANNSNHIVQSNETFSLSEDLNNSLSKDNHIKVDNHKVLALTSNLARANAVSMDGFKRHLLIKEKALDMLDSAEDLTLEKQPLTNVSFCENSSTAIESSSQKDIGSDVKEDSIINSIEYIV